MAPSNLPMNKATPDVILAAPHLQVRNIALTLFAEQGYQSVSLRKLASALGIQAANTGGRFPLVENTMENLSMIINETPIINANAR